MAYVDFTNVTQVAQDFNLTIEEDSNLFADIEPIEPSQYLQLVLEENLPLAHALDTEQAHSELITAPVLLELRRIFEFQVGIFSSTEFNVDAEIGLFGLCDFILSASQEMDSIKKPVFILVQGRKENIESKLGQCLATMVAAQKFNQQQGHEIEEIYGCLTMGTIWKFLKLIEQNVLIDLDDYSIKRVDKILGILACPY